ncbi:MAG: DUF4890 domain-containing protein [Bacteroidaceae bacterium]|nr:DUF4890 domain-containing protein [Bacteroidaceae bacterium]
MKKFGLILLAFVAMVAGVAAQDRGDRGNRRGPRMNRATIVERMTARQVERLSLNEEQTARMKELNAEYFAQLEQLMRAGGSEPTDSVAGKKVTKEERKAQREAMEEKTKAVRADYLAKVKEVLTPEQYAEFEKMEKERPQGRPGGRRGPGSRDRGGNRGFGNPPSDDFME